jgi:hypothetical protein
MRLKKHNYISLRKATQFFEEYMPSIEEGHIIWVGGEKYIYKNCEWELIENNSNDRRENEACEQA